MAHVTLSDGYRLHGLGGGRHRVALVVHQVHSDENRARPSQPVAPRDVACGVWDERYNTGRQQFRRERRFDEDTENVLSLRDRR